VLLLLGLIVTYDGNLYIAAAVRAGYIKSDRLAHQPFSNCCNYGVDVIQAVVKHIQLPPYIFHIQRLLLSR